MESGFSINKDILIENMNERTIVSQRIVYDAIDSAGGSLKIKINKNMITSCQLANSRYKSALEDTRQEEKHKPIENERKHHFFSEIKVLEEKKSKLAKNSQYECSTIDRKLWELRKQM